MRRELCSQKRGLRKVGNQVPLAMRPCWAGARPVRREACATQVTAGKTEGRGEKVRPHILVRCAFSRVDQPRPAAITVNFFMWGRPPGGVFS